MEKHAPFPAIKSLIRTIYLHDGRVGAKLRNPHLHKEVIPEFKSWFSQPSDRGLPIGNLTSQFGANVYLTALDHFIQRELKPMAYMRYMDDLLLIDRDPNLLVQREEPIDQWLRKNRFQSLNPSKSHLIQLGDGITYLGSDAAQVGGPGNPLQFFPDRKKKWKLVQGLRRIKDLQNEPLSLRPHPLSATIPNPKWNQEIASLNSRFGSIVHAESYDFRKKALEHLEYDFTGPTLPPEFASKPWVPFEIKKGYRAIRLR